MCPPRTILMIDDDVELCDVVTWAFREAGINVACTDSREEALSILHNLKPIAVLFEWMLPTWDARQAIREIQNAQFGIPIMVVTGYLEDERIAELRRLGVRDARAIPHDVDDLLEMVGRAVGMELRRNTNAA